MLHSCSTAAITPFSDPSVARQRAGFCFAVSHPSSLTPPVQGSAQSTAGHKAICVTDSISPRSAPAASATPCTCRRNARTSVCKPGTGAVALPSHSCQLTQSCGKLGDTARTLGTSHPGAPMCGGQIPGRWCRQLWASPHSGAPWGQSSPWAGWDGETSTSM